MPGLTAALASLQDVLEVKGCSISEPELWSVLCLCAEALQDVLFKGNSQFPSEHSLQFCIRVCKGGTTFRVTLAS